MSYSERVKAELTDSVGNNAEIGVFGGLKISDPTPQIQQKFDRPLVFGRTVDLISGTPVAQFNGSLARLVNGDAFSTIAVLRYITGQTIEVWFTAGFVGTFEPGGGDTFIGLFDDDSGVFIGYRGDQFVVGYRNTRVGADVVQPVTPPTNVENITRYRVRLGYLGVGDITFEYKVSGQEWEVLHTFTTDGNLSARTHIGSTILPMRAQCNHVSGELQSGSWNAQTYGRDDALQEVPYFTYGERTIINSPTPVPLVAFRLKPNNGAYPNKMLIELLQATIATGSEGIYRVLICGAPGGQLITGAWVDASPLSIVEKNETFTDALPASAVVVASVVLTVQSQGTGVGVTPADLSRLGLRLRPGREALFYVQEILPGQDRVFSYDINYTELF